MDQNQLRNIRKEYKHSKLDRESLSDNPMELMRAWLEDAIKAGEPEPTAMTLATTVDSMPSARIVLLKDLRDEGLVFFTNYLSRKGLELSTNPNASVVLFWPTLERQIRVEGAVRKLPAEESRDYFNSRPLPSRISAAISPQSQVIPNDRSWLETRFKQMAEKDHDQEINMPSDWGGYLLSIRKVEFWQGRSDRLHDRFLYIQDENESRWVISRLAP